MPRPPKDLTPWKDDIVKKVRQKETLHEIKRWLLTQGCNVGLSTLKAATKDWGATRRAESATPQIVEIIQFEFHHTTDTDEEIAITLAEAGHQSSRNQVKEIRLKHGWLRRADTYEQMIQQRAATFTTVEQSLAEGTTRSYGKGFFKTALLHQGHRVRNDDLQDAMQLLDKPGTESRKPFMKKLKQGEFITPGPNWIWSVDGHDKFRNFGIEIYAGIDGYSRFIPWAYVGNSNRKGVSVLWQYLMVILALGLRPNFIRSDRGKETLMLGDAQFSFHCKAEILAHQHDEQPFDETTCSIRECYMFGTSTANHRIESLWGRLIARCTKTWLVCSLANLSSHTLLILSSPTFTCYKVTGGTRATASPIRWSSSTLSCLFYVMRSIHSSKLTTIIQFGCSMGYTITSLASPRSSGPSHLEDANSAFLQTFL